jgi:alpha-L-rhamnosidase
LPTTLTPYDLTCELVATPLGIDEPAPRLAWRLRSDRRGDAQTGYRLRVAERADDLDRPDRVLWDTGRVDSPENFHIAYDGPPLRSGTRYHWRVTVWDVDGDPAAPVTSWFETGLLHGDEWRASWIGRDPLVEPPVEPPRELDRSSRTRHLAPPLHLRRAFPLGGVPVRSARLYASARGLYELRLNGHRVGDHELAPGWTEYHQRIMYQTYDVTDLLAAGENVLAAVVADGWWSGFVGFDMRRPAQHYGTAPQLLAQLVLDHADGSRRVVVTDGGWRERPGPVVYADLLHGERVDARLALPGWDRPGYDDSDWPPAAVLDTDTGVLTAMPDHPVRVVAELSPVTVDRRGDGTFVVDLGENLVGRVRLTVRGAPAGTRIDLRHAEVLDADGALYTANLRTAEATDTYLAAGGAVEVFEPRFTCHGFRYVQVRGYPGELRAEDITGRVLATDTPPAGEFGCSDELVNRLHANIRRSQRGNFVSVPTDCPQRDERLGWTADAQIFAPTACRTADVSAFFARWLRDLVGGQDADGAFGDVAPKVCLRREGAPGWGDAGVIIPWHLYRTYGDARVLADSFPAMRAWVEHIRRHNPDLIWRHRVGNHYGDWLQVDVETPRELLATAYFARSTQLVARAAGALGHDADEKRYTELHAAVRDAFVDAFVTPDGRVHGGTQTGYLLALGFGLLPEHLVGAAVGHLVADLEARDRHLTTGFAGVALLCPVLTVHGHADLAYALLHQDTFPSWLYPVRHGATTIWERWDGWTAEAGYQSPAMNSFNHYSLGAVGDWLYGRVAGIDQDDDSVGYRRLLLRPTPGGRLDHASARFASPRGEVACGWRRTGPDLEVTAEVPPGATAVLHLPTTDPDSVRLPAGPHVTVLARDAGELVLELASGRYHFTTVDPFPKE